MIDLRTSGGYIWYVLKSQLPHFFRYNSLIAHESKDSGHGRWDDDDPQM